MQGLKFHLIQQQKIIHATCISYPQHNTEEGISHCHSKYTVLNPFQCLATISCDKTRKFNNSLNENDCLIV